MYLKNLEAIVSCCVFGEFFPFFSADPLKLSGWIRSVAAQLFSGLFRDV
jgi:hypothetical protein